MRSSRTLVLFVHRPRSDAAPGAVHQPTAGVPAGNEKLTGMLVAACLFE